MNGTAAKLYRNVGTPSAPAWEEVPFPFAITAQFTPIPVAAAIGCDGCGIVWTQSLAESLAAPTDPVRCPACGSVKCNPGEADTPHIVEGGPRA